MNVCKNKCETLTTKHYNIINKFLIGYKKCRTCCICIKTEEYKCPCCLRTEKEIRKNGGWPDRTIWVLDHNHTTKEFRGWICDNCNVAIGRFADSVSSLKKAINYLKDENENLRHSSR